MHVFDLVKELKTFGSFSPYKVDGNLLSAKVQSSSPNLFQNFLTTEEYFKSNYLSAWLNVFVITADSSLWTLQLPEKLISGLLLSNCCHIITWILKLYSQLRLKAIPLYLTVKSFSIRYRQRLHSCRIAVQLSNGQKRFIFAFIQCIKLR
jgi:hypothetical protein